MADQTERQTLDDLGTELLLPLPGRNRLMGVMALGPKQSEAAYSKSDMHLLQVLATQTGMALEVSELAHSLAHEAAQRERANREMEIAREVQERLFPQSRPPVAGVDYCGLCRPALAVGGDYFDYIPCTGGRLGLALGDVSGKGISAALMMASLQSLLRGQLAAGLDNVATLLTNTNRLIYDVSTSNRYVTFFYGEFDPATRRLLYVNAGHNPPIILRGDEVIRLEACGPVVGLLRSVAYESAEFQFESGDILIAFTDGISEAMTVEDEEWGDDRLIEAARACYDENASGMTKSIMRAADTFTAGAEQHDDMTVIVWKLL
jgi:sigma-B regulation protein RsbU (phosphoserine phosphatase)